MFRLFPDDCNTFCPASESSARQQRLFVQHQVTKQHVVCSFGLCAGLIRQREFPADGFVRSQNIILLFMWRLIKSLSTVHFSWEMSLVE